MSWRWRLTVLSFIVAGFFWWTVVERSSILGVIGGSLFTLFGLLEAVGRGAARDPRIRSVVDDRSPESDDPPPRRPRSDLELAGFTALYGLALTLPCALYLLPGPPFHSLPIAPIVLWGFLGAACLAAGVIAAMRAERRYAAAGDPDDVVMREGGEVLRFVYAAESIVLGYLLLVLADAGGSSLGVIVSPFLFVSAVFEALGRGTMGWRDRHPTVDDEAAEGEEGQRVPRAAAASLAGLMAFLGGMMLFLCALNVFLTDSTPWGALALFSLFSAGFLRYGLQRRRRAKSAESA